MADLAFLEGKLKTARAEVIRYFFAEENRLRGPEIDGRSRSTFDIAKSSELLQRKEKAHLAWREFESARSRKNK